MATAAASWTVSKLEIELRGSSSSLYANGLHQIHVVINVEARNPDNSSYTLTQSELSKIRLINYDSSGDELPSGWTYTKTPNEFAGPSSSQANSADDEPRAGEQRQNYYVSTSVARSVKIATSLQQPDRYVYASNDTSEGRRNGVTVTGQPKITYTTSKIDVKEKSDFSDGFVPFVEWKQHNYYVTNKESNKPFIKSTVNNVKRSAPGQPGWINCCMMRDGGKKDSPTRHWYVWDMDSEERRTVGTKGGFSNTATVTVNNQRNAVCITRVDFEPKKFNPEAGWYFADTWFQVWDIYGNTGKFTANMTGGDLDRLDIRDRNNLPQGETEQTGELILDPASSGRKAALEDYAKRLVQQLPVHIRQEIPQTNVAEFLGNLPGDHAIVQQLKEAISKENLTDGIEAQT